LRPCFPPPLSGFPKIVNAGPGRLGRSPSFAPSPPAGEQMMDSFVFLIHFPSLFNADHAVARTSFGKPETPLLVCFPLIAFPSSPHSRRCRPPASFFGPLSLRVAGILLTSGLDLVDRFFFLYLLSLNAAVTAPRPNLLESIQTNRPFLSPFPFRSPHYPTGSSRSRL